MSSNGGTSSGSAVSSGLRAQRQDERRRALVALLRQPLLTPGGRYGEALPLVRRHSGWLREWFARHCGWNLYVESELARLHKTPGNPNDPTRPLLDSKQQPFTRRSYVLLCLALAALERSERQTVLRRLADETAGALASDPELAQCGMTFDLALREHRRDLVEVIRHLMDLNVLRRIDGDEQQFIASEQQDVLYNINRAALAAMLNVRRGPSTIVEQTLAGRLRAMLDELYPDTEEGRHRRLRTRLFRRLIDDPVIYYDQLDDEERRYLTSQRPSIARELESVTGFLQEARREGLAMVDPLDMATDVSMPEEGTDGHVTLLLAEYLARRLRRSEVPVDIASIEQYTEELIRTHRSHWRRDAGEPGAAAVLTREALRRLRMLRLIELDDMGLQVVPLPTIGRFALGQMRSNSVEAGDGEDATGLWT